MGERGEVELKVALAANVIGLIVVNTHPLWRGWTGGFVTPAFSDVVFAADLAMIVVIVGNLVLLRVPETRRYRKVADAVFTAAGLLSLWVFHDVYPLDFAAVGLEQVDPVVRFALGFALFAVVLALVVNLLRAAGSVLESGSAGAPSPPEEDESATSKPRRPTPQQPPPPRKRRR